MGRGLQHGGISEVEERRKVLTEEKETNDDTKRKGAGIRVN